MKRILLAAMPIGALAIMALINIEPLPLGSSIPSPEVKMKDITGKEVSLKDARTKKGLLVMFSCNTCPYVIKNQDRTNDACKTAQDKGIGVAILNSNEAKRGADDSMEDMMSYAKSQG